MISLEMFSLLVVAAFGAPLLHALSQIFIMLAGGCTAGPTGFINLRPGTAAARWGTARGRRAAKFTSMAALSAALLLSFLTFGAANTQTTWSRYPECSQSTLPFYNPSSSSCVRQALL